MLNYGECKVKAEERAAAFNATIDKAYKIGSDYVFENSKEEYIGVLPLVVDTETGAIKGLWQYLLDKDMTMDDMTEIEF